MRFARCLVAPVLLLSAWTAGGVLPEWGGPDFVEARRTNWAFRPPAAVAPPPVRDRRWIKSPLDQFILARLEARKLAPAPPADKRTLLRRATFDLTGLPPSP